MSIASYHLTISLESNWKAKFPPAVAVAIAYHQKACPIQSHSQEGPQRNLLQVGPLKTWKYTTYRSLWTTRLKCNLWEDDKILSRSHHGAEQAERSFIGLPSQTPLICIVSYSQAGWISQTNRHRWMSVTFKVSLHVTCQLTQKVAKSFRSWCGYVSMSA